ncbi:MAG: putative O-glycosylation ligase, exosortase A system-associated [Hydrogenophilales bacterium 28-61-23]|nr:MAG: putative O-glycosylation ligase, exosortase A system-associated [Hydrogenophilales bacterium 28-61-23]
MHDFPLLLMALALAGTAWRRAWVGLLGVLVVGLLHPQNYALDFMRGMPVYAVLLANVLLATAWEFARHRTWPRLFWDRHIGVLLVLWAWFALTTYYAINPAMAPAKLFDVSKLLLPMALIGVLIDSKEKLRWLLITLALSIAAIVFKGGYWALIHGFQDRVYGPEGSAYGGNNEFAVLTAMAIPLLLFWYRGLHGQAWRWAVAGLAVLAFVSAISSWSRGGLLSVLAVAVLLVWQSRRKGLAIPLLAIGIGLLFAGLPDAWFARMQTLGAPELDDSAASRLIVWRMGWNYALSHPWFGSGFESWVLFAPPDVELRAWHSAYVQVAAEHGLVGLALYAGLIGSTLWSLLVLMARGGHDRRARHEPSVTRMAAAIFTALAAYLVGAAFLSIAYWELLFLLLAAAWVLRRLALNPAPPA